MVAHILASLYRILSSIFENSDTSRPCIIIFIYMLVNLSYYHSRFSENKNG